MKPLIAVLMAVLSLGAFSGTASAFCLTSDPSQGCPQPFAGTNASKLNGTGDQQGFDAQTGTHWSTSTNTMGGVTFYSGMSTSNPWDSRDHMMGNGFNGPGFSSQAGPNSPHCLFYGSCQ